MEREAGDAELLPGGVNLARLHRLLPGDEAFRDPTGDDPPIGGVGSKQYQQQNNGGETETRRAAHAPSYSGPPRPPPARPQRLPRQTFSTSALGAASNSQAFTVIDSML